MMGTQLQMSDSDAELRTSDSEGSDSEAELQEAFAQGLLKPGLNTVEKAPKKVVYNSAGLKQKLDEIKLNLPWIERLDCTNKEAPLAPELAAKMSTHEEKRQSQLLNNKKLPQVDPKSDPVLNDFKREMSFHRQAQATVIEAVPKLKAIGLSTIRPEDYFAEMAKSDEHMQKIRSNLMKKQAGQQRSEKVKQLRLQRKAGKTLQVQAKLQRQREKKEMMEQVKKVRKGVSKNLDFLEGNKKGGVNNMKSKRAMDKKRIKDNKFGFGGKKKGSKLNTRESSMDVSEYRRPMGNKKNAKGKSKNKPNKNRPGKSKRMKTKNKGKK